LRVASALLLLLGCSGPARLSSGAYTLTHVFADDTGIDVVPQSVMELDVEAGTVRWTGTERVVMDPVEITVWDRSDWPTGCPTNTSATSMEVASVALDELVVDGWVVEDPLLVALCPDGRDVLVRPDGAFDVEPCGNGESQPCLTYVR
jgi:hypothetical protein